jgi:hypothetical protein
LIFDVDGHDVCLVAFLRILGVTTSTDVSRVPGQWQRLVKGFTEKKESETLLDESELHLDAGEEYTNKEGHATAFIGDCLQFYADSLPTVTAEDGVTECMQMPYGNAVDIFNEYEFHYDAFGIGKRDRASRSTFMRAWKKIYKDGKGLVKLLGGKSGFQACLIITSLYVPFYILSYFFCIYLFRPARYVTTVSQSRRVLAASGT